MPWTARRSTGPLCDPPPRGFETRVERAPQPNDREGDLRRTVELRGLEPLTLSLRTRCATSCATAPSHRPKCLLTCEATRCARLAPGLGTAESARGRPSGADGLLAGVVLARGSTAYPVGCLGGVGLACESRVGLACGPRSTPRSRRGRSCAPRVAPAAWRRTSAASPGRGPRAAGRARRWCPCVGLASAGASISSTSGSPPGAAYVATNGSQARSLRTINRHATSQATSRATGAAAYVQPTRPAAAAPRTPAERQDQHGEHPAAPPGRPVGGRPTRGVLLVGRRRRCGCAGLAPAGRGGACRRLDQPGLPCVDGLAARQDPHPVGEPVDRTAALDVVVMTKRLGDQIGGPGDGQGHEDESAQVHDPTLGSLPHRPRDVNWCVAK